MRLTSSRSTGSLSDRSRSISFSVSVSGVSARNCDHCSAEKKRKGEYFSVGASWSIESHALLAHDAEKCEAVFGRHHSLSVSFDQPRGRDAFSVTRERQASP